MAIEKEKFSDLVKFVEDSINAIPMPKEVTNWLTQALLGPSIDLLRKYIAESRAPKIYIIGRSGHGKSSLMKR